MIKILLETFTDKGEQNLEDLDPEQLNEIFKNIDSDQLNEALKDHIDFSS